MYLEKQSKNVLYEDISVGQLVGHHQTYKDDRQQIMLFKFVSLPILIYLSA